MTKIKQQPHITTVPTPNVSGPGPGFAGRYSARREGAVDHDIGERRLSAREVDHSAADLDYRRGLSMPQRRVTGDHRVNRDQAGEPGQYRKR
jgi:hypothetical protein